MEEKLQAIEKKVIVGGVDLLQKMEDQEKLLDESAKELEERQKKQEALKRELEEKEAERIDIEEKYVNLQEEAAGKTKKLKKVWTMLMSAKSEVRFGGGFYFHCDLETFSLPADWSFCL